MLRRLVLPFALALLAVGAGLAAIRSEQSEPRVDDGTVALAPVTPVLSARRVPELVAAPVGDRRLQAALTDLLRRMPTQVCLTVTSGGRQLFASNQNLSLVPASLAKLLTASAALDVLGPDAAYRTRVVAETGPDDGVVAGDLYVLGSGDPVLMTDPYEARFRHQPQIHTDVEELADRIVAAGVRRVNGSVVGDGTRYDDERYVDAWPDRFVAQDVSGPLGALTVDDGWATYPPDADAQTPDETPAADPAAHAAELLTRLLRARGVAIDGAPRAGPSQSEHDTEIAAIDSPPIRDIVGEMLRESDNQTAELVTKELGTREGGAGTTVAGARVIAETVARLGLAAPDDVSVVDGSGLASNNRLSCSTLQATLDTAGAESIIADGLPVAGQTGTLDIRFVDSAVAGRMRAKTGTLNQVSGLAGFLETIEGAQLTFAFLQNLPDDARIGDDDLAFQDELASILVRYPDGPSLADLSPEPLPPEGG